MKRKGSILVISLIFLTVASLILASLLAMQKNYHKVNAKSMDRTKALYHAESSTQLVLYELRHKNAPARWGSYSNGGSWSVSGTLYTYTDTDGTVFSCDITGLS